MKKIMMGKQPFFKAIRLEEPATVKNLLKVGAQPNKRSKNNEVPLSIAIGIKQKDQALEIIYHLVEKKANPCYVGSNGERVLTMLIKSEHSDFFFYVIQKVPFDKATYSEALEAALLAKYNNIASKLLKLSGHNLLLLFYTACTLNHRRVVDKVLRVLNYSAEYLEQGLFCATYNGHNEIVYFLLSDTRINNCKPEFNPLRKAYEFARDSSLNDIMAMLLKSDNKFSNQLYIEKLRDALHTNHIKDITFLLKTLRKNIYVVQDEINELFEQVACVYCNSNSLQKLWEHCAVVITKEVLLTTFKKVIQLKDILLITVILPALKQQALTEEIENTLKAAINEDYISLIKAIIMSKVLQDLQNKYSGAIYLLLAKKNKLEVARLLLENGLKLEFNKTAIPLHIVVLQNNVAAVLFLLDLGVDINEQDHNGNTPLLHAAKLGLAEIVTLLITRNADVEILNAYGKNAIGIAIENEHFGIAKILQGDVIYEHGHDKSNAASNVVDKKTLEQPSCSICCEDMKEEEVTITLSCTQANNTVLKHRFHAACIQPWLRGHSECPLCRSKVAQKDKDLVDLMLQRH